MVSESANQMTDAEGEDPESTQPLSAIERLRASVSPEEFDQWYREREFRQNIRDGKHYFNSPAPVKDPERHSPSSLMQCHRKVAYRQSNAPEEEQNPRGIFWTGSKFEEEIVLPYLQQGVVGPDEYVTNSLWVDFEVKTEAGNIRIKGETDPAIVTADNTPLLVTEVKTKDSIDHVESPNTHHKAQLHAYMAGLSEEQEQNISHGIILYGSRTTLDIEVFDIEFDPFFWRESVLKWASEHTSYRLDDVLPPADPEYGWECKFCSFKERCGEGEEDVADLDSRGLIPAIGVYPGQKVSAYLEAVDGAMLPPELAMEFPDLAAGHGVLDWQCDRCSSAFEWGSEEVEEEEGLVRPICPSCSGDEQESLLRGPPPAEQPRGD